MYTAPNDSHPYIPYQQWPEYRLENDPPDFFKPESFTQDGIIGIRWRLGILRFEESVSDREPRVGKHPYGRIVFWQRIYRRDIPKGWHQGFFAKSPHKIGYAQIKQTEYWKAWPETTRYYRRKWLKECLDKKYSIEKVELEAYKEAYLQSSVVKKVGLRQIEKLERKMNLASKNINLWGVRRLSDHKIVAGLGVINSQTFASSNHFSAFMHEEVKGDRISLGLVDHWFKDSLVNNIKLLDFGIFWQKGDPSSWKGFSEFKGQFDITFISLPPRLFKIVFKQG